MDELTLHEYNNERRILSTGRKIQGFKVKVSILPPPPFPYTLKGLRCFKIWSNQSLTRHCFLLTKLIKSDVKNMIALGQIYVIL